MISKKTTRIAGITLTIIGLSVFIISYIEGSIGQESYSNLGCAVNAAVSGCAITNNQMTAGFLGMIFSFFTALFGASLVVPSILIKIVKRGSRFEES